MLSEKVRSIIKYAYNNSPFYKWFYDQSGVNIDALQTIDDLHDFPILTKEILQNHKDEIIVNKLKNYTSDMIQITRTSGTSGRMIEVLWDKNDYSKSILSLWRRRRKWYNILPSSKGVVFSNFIYNGSNFLPIRDVRLINKNILSVNRNFTSEKEIYFLYNQISDFSPEWMQIQPSVGLKLVDYLYKYNLSNLSSLKYIELNGEMVTNAQKKYISDFFMVPTANMYGANEVNAIAIDCPNGNMHILNDNVYVESTSDSKILVTNLHNHVMPIIRYSLEDYITIKKNDCCMDEGEVIDGIIGRSLDYVFLNNGASISPYFIIYSIEHVGDILHKCILQFQIEQNNIGEINIYVEVKTSFRNWHSTIIDEIRNEIYKYVSEKYLKITVSINDNNFFFQNGEDKFRVFRSTINER